MIVDVHCHVGFSAKRADPSLPRFSFEPDGSRGQPGFDSYFSPQVKNKWGGAFRFAAIRRAAGFDLRQPAGDELDRRIAEFNERHFSAALKGGGVDRLVLLAFDEYHRDDGAVRGPPRLPSEGALWFSARRKPRSPIEEVDSERRAAESDRNTPSPFKGEGRGEGHSEGQIVNPAFLADGPERWLEANKPADDGYGSDLYVSNTLVRAMCVERPDRYWFGASIHPYRTHEGRPAWELLDELKAAGAVLIKWLPIHQNIRAGDPRTVAFLRRAAELKLAMLIHYGGEMTLARQHKEFESPAEMLDVLRDLRRDGQMPTTIIAHAATPSLRFQSAAGHHLLMDALLHEFRDAPLYADISALAALGRSPWLPRLAKRKELHAKLVWGTDYPVPIFPLAFWRTLGRKALEIGRISSWIERDLALKRAMGFDEGVFRRAGEILTHVAKEVSTALR